MLDSAVTTKDLHTGELSSLVGRSDASILHTDILHIMHSNIPHPHMHERAVFTTSIIDPPSVLELKNQYDVLWDMTNNFLDNDHSNASSDEAKPRAESPSRTVRVVALLAELTKQLASNSSRVKASIEKMTTILSPTLTAKHQSRPSPHETAAVTNA